MSINSQENSAKFENYERRELSYRPVHHHWFYNQNVQDRFIWHPFSKKDSTALEESYKSANSLKSEYIATDGGRYDVNISQRTRTAVYWETSPNEVRRCSWFYKTSADGRYIPFEETLATKLEEEYKVAFETNQWHHKIELPCREYIMLHGPDILVLFSQVPASNESIPRPRIVKRGVDEIECDDGEPMTVDHLLFLVHGIGSVCDLKFRPLEEVVDDFRALSLQLVQSHYKTSCEKNLVHRIEVLPISWHKKLHSDSTGIDSKLKQITLDSIPRLRDFTNDTLLDILFYSSPIFCQTIISTVGSELNRLYDLFKQRNPSFSGNVSVGGHSLGSLILFDLLCHQKKMHNNTEDNDETRDTFSPIKHVKKIHSKSNLMSRRISYMMSVVGTGQPELTYPHLNFEPIAFFALGSPIGMFVTVRGLESLGENFELPTCPAFFNIFHPYDPVAYRMEALINPDLANVRPVLIPHHKGRKRMHLELKETMTRVGADMKQRIMNSVRNTWKSLTQIILFTRPDLAIKENDKVLEEQLPQNSEFHFEVEPDLNLSFGILNSGRRIDYVLQEAPLEFFNEYIFALTSHCCYWDSEDTMLLILKEIYSASGCSPDNQIPQQTMIIDRSL